MAGWPNRGGKMKRRSRASWIVLPVVALLAGGVAFAEEGKGSSKSAKKGGGKGGVLRALHLPIVAQKTRGKGVPTKEVRKAIRALRKSKVKPGEATEALEEAAAAADEKGPVENFGDFVQSKLDEGLRGRALAKAIHDEHSKRGIGKGKKLPDAEADTLARKRGKRGKRLGHAKHGAREHDKAERKADKRAEKREMRGLKGERKGDRRDLKAAKKAHKGERKEAKAARKGHKMKDKHGSKGGKKGKGN